MRIIIAANFKSLVTYLQSWFDERMKMSEEIQTPREFVLKAFEASLIEFDELYEELAK